MHDINNINEIDLTNNINHATFIPETVETSNVDVENSLFRLLFIINSLTDKDIKNRKVKIKLVESLCFSTAIKKCHCPCNTKADQLLNMLVYLSPDY